MTEPPLLTVRGLVAGYGSTIVLHEVDVHARRGEIVAVVGPNGAGKTTLARALTGFARVTAGEVLLDGTDVLRLPAHRRARAGLVQVPEGRRLFARFSVEQNLAMSFLGGAREASPAHRAELLDRTFGLFPVLHRRLDQEAGTLSGGEQQMLSIARAVLLEPRVLVLDEPSTGLAPMVVTSILEAVATLVRDSASCCVLIEQRAGLALAVADHGYALERGRIAASGSAGELAAAPVLGEGLLGA
jgi:branched-chain amino acid transport system ATP-binding protein